MGGADTIAALATPFGQGAISVLRISGPEAVAVADKVFRGSVKVVQAASGRVSHGRIVDGDSVVDDVLLTVFRAPRSYTGEDVVEISGHGGMVVARATMKAVLAAGARPAEPGEFTRRAFLNGKLDLTQAEAVMDLISARSDAAARAAAGQLAGRLGEEVEKLRQDVLVALAHLEAFIDFPEEGIDPESGKILRGRLEDVSAGVARLLSTADEGRMLREGVRLVIHGEPNVGKSSLLNLLLGYDRAIVSAIPGTTRDTIEENLTLGGLPFRIVDTAGFRDSSDPLEQEGMRRAAREVEQADVAVRVFDNPSAAAQSTPGNEIRVLNKIDLWPAEQIPPGVVAVSCLDGRGLSELVAAIGERSGLLSMGKLEETVAVNARHQHCLSTGASFLAASIDSLGRGNAPELTAVELRSALASLGEITGAGDHEEVLDKIFGAFCIGK